MSIEELFEHGNLNAEFKGNGGADWIPEDSGPELLIIEGDLEGTNGSESGNRGAIGSVGTIDVREL